MATWSKTTRLIEVHEWHVPNGCWNQLQQALSDAYKTRARMLNADGDDDEISDTDLLFKATDDGVIVYFEAEVPKKKPGWEISSPDPWANGEPPF